MKKILIAVFVITFTAFFVTGSALAKGTIKIGAIYPFTGQMAAYAEDAKRALDFAQEEINAAGGINGNEVKFILEDDGGTPKGGVSAAQKLIEIDKVDAIVGCLFSSVVLAVKPILNANKVVLVAPMASNPDVYIGTKYIISLTPTDNDNCYVNAKYCTQVLKKKTLGTLYMMNDTGIASDRLLSKWWEQFGGKALIRESFKPGVTDFRTELTKIRAANPDTLYICVTWREGVNVLKQVSEMNLKSHITANSQVREPKLLELAGTVAEGMTFTTSYTGGTEEDKRVKEKFEKEFTARYKQPPAIVGFSTYDCAKVVFEAMKRGATKGDSLRDTIVKLNMPGVFGPIRFREDGSPRRDTAMWLVKDGKFFDLNYIDAAP
jgi:branched-chain amino acid transport system substrate-binding protein